MLRYEQIIKEFLEEDGCKLIGLEQDGRMIITDREDNQRIFRVELCENNLIIKNVYDEIEYTIKLR